MTVFLKEFLKRVILKKSTDDNISMNLFDFVALRLKSTAMVMAGRSVHLTTLFPRQA